MSKLPDWIDENLPRELVESTLFRFIIELQTVRSFACRKCGAKHAKKVEQCDAVGEDGNQCGSTNFIKEHKKITVDMLPDLDLDYELLEQTMQDIPAQYAFYSMVYSEARMKVALEERKLKAVRGTITRRIQTEASHENVRLTAEQVKSVIEASDDIINADTKLQLAQMQCGKLYHMIEALRIKAELARSLAGFKKQDQNN
jgi:ribosomal protein L40E